MGIPIIFGWGKKAKDLGYLGIVKCPNCRNYVTAHLYEIAKRVSVYFIPVAKFGKKYYVVCPLCDAGCEIDAAQKNGLLAEGASLPPEDSALAIWESLDTTLATALGEGEDLEEAIVQTVEEVSAAYPREDVEYVGAMYLEYLADEDTPE